jgi:hypothetical protein
MDNASTDAPVWMTSLAALIVFGVLLAGVLWRHARLRIGLQEWAQGLGLHYAEDARGTVPLPNYFHLLKPGVFKTQPRIGEAILGEVDGVAVYLFRFRRYRGEDMRQIPRLHGYPQTVGLFIVPGMDLPKFSLFPERLHHKIAQTFGDIDVDFSSSTTFSRKYLLRGEVQSAVRKAFTEDIRGYLERKPGRVAQGFANELIYYRPTPWLRPTSFNPRDAQKLLEEGLALVNLMRAT